MPPLFHFIALFAICSLTAAGVFVRGRKLLGVVMFFANLIYAAGMQYLINSPELPGFSAVSTQYSVVSVVTNSSLFVYLLGVALACWGVGGSNTLSTGHHDGKPIVSVRYPTTQ